MVSICNHDGFLPLAEIALENYVQIAVLVYLNDVFTVGVREPGSNCIHLCVLLLHISLNNTSAADN